MATKKTVRNLLEDELKDLYSAENQLTKALPKMLEGSNDTDLKAAFISHLRETHEHVRRLEEVGKVLDIGLTGRKCTGMEGVIKEGAEALEEKGDATILDLGIIAAGSRVEHYEMAGYITAINLAGRIGANEVVGLLEETLAEEEAAEKSLRKISSSLMKNATTEAGKAA